MKSFFFSISVVLFALVAVPQVAFGLTLDPATQEVSVGNALQRITVSGGSGAYQFTLSSGDTGITLGSTCPSLGSSCLPSLGYFPGTAQLTVTDATNTSQKATATITLVLPEDCRTDLTAHTFVDWRQEYLVPGDDGYAWKRAIITDPAGVMELEEGKTQKIIGTADHYAEVQVYVFQEQRNSSGALLPPTSGACLSAGYADESGLFQTGINATLLWSLLGKNVVVDAYYRTPFLWKDLQESFTGQNFFIGTHNDMTILHVEGDKSFSTTGITSDSCSALCSDVGMVGVKVLNPATAPNPEILSDNFQSIADTSAIIGRIPGVHTFYARTDPQIGASQKDLEPIVHKVLLVETIKRFLLGNAFVGGSAKGVDVLSQENLVDVALDSTRVYSAKTRTLVENLKTLLLMTSSTLERKNASENIFSALPQLSSLQSESLTNISAETIAEVFPAISEETYSFETTSFPNTISDAEECLLTARKVSDAEYWLDYTISWGDTATNATLTPGGNSFSRPTGEDITVGSVPITPEEGATQYVLREENGLFECRAEAVVVNEQRWADDLLDIFAFWTGRLTSNECIFLDDNEFSKNFYFRKNIDTSFCDFQYVSGDTPQLLLHSGVEGFLEPDFEETTLTFSDSPFDEGEEGWKFQEGEKEPIFYRYEFLQPLDASPSKGSWCVSRETLPTFVPQFAQYAHLDLKEEEILLKELQKEIWGERSFHLELMPEESIRSRIFWKLNGNPISLFTAFFKISESDSCSEKDFSFSFSPAFENRMGFEVGFLH